MTEAAPRRPLLVRLRAFMPWLFAALLLGWLFSIVPLNDLARMLQRPPLVPFIALTLVYIGVTLLADSFATWATFRAALPDVKLRYVDTLELRAASYILAIVHYGAGQGALGWFLHRRHGVEIARVTGAVMLVMGVNVVVVALAAFLGVMLGGAPEADALRWVVLALGCGFPAYLAVIAVRPRFLTRIRFVKPLFEAGLKGHLRAAAARIPHIAWLIAVNFVALRMFDVDIPIGKAIALFPIVFVVGVLPISPSGWGTVQAACIALFTPFAPGTIEDRRAAVLAYSLTMQFAGLIIQAAIGLVFLRRAMRKGNLEKAGDTPPA
jgi:hypothetical protein